jgi:hypothetical protein
MNSNINFKDKLMLNAAGSELQQVFISNQVFQLILLQTTLMSKILI